jgi:hypothetical protein
VQVAGDLEDLPAVERARGRSAERETRRVREAPLIADYS